MEMAWISHVPSPRALASLLSLNHFLSLNLFLSPNLFFASTSFALLYLGLPQYRRCMARLEGDLGSEVSWAACSLDTRGLGSTRSEAPKHSDRRLGRGLNDTHEGSSEDLIRLASAWVESI